jgi:proteasome lid subunit RPN8/RPN11
MNREEGNAAAVNFLLRRALVEEMYAHAREASPAECCGLLGGRGRRAESVYRLRNVAGDASVAYEAAPEDLFAAQRRMRERGEELLGIYHSHPRSADPVPSPTDVKLAFYPSALYFIVGFDGAEPTLRAFRISEREGSWERAEFVLADG